MVEMLVAMAVSGIVMALIVSIFMAQQKSFVRDRNIKEVHQDAQDLLQMLKLDLLEAGFSVQSNMAFYIEDGGSNRSDKIFINDASIIDIAPVEDWGDPPVMPVDMRRLITNSCPTCVAVSGGQNTSSVQLSSLQVSDGGCSSIGSSGACDSEQLCEWLSGACTRRNDFQGGIYQFIISNSGTNKIAKINSISGNALSLDRILGGNTVAPAVYYCVDDGSSDCHPSTSGSELWVLRRSDRWSGGRLAVVENVVDLQIVYQDLNGNWYGGAGCAGSGAGQGFCRLSPFNPSQIQRMRLSLVVRGKNQDRRRIDDSNTCRPALANRPGTNIADAAARNAECGYVYRVYDILLQPRNAR